MFILVCIYIKFTPYFCYYLYLSDNKNAGKWLDVTKNKVALSLFRQFQTAGLLDRPK